MSGRFFGSYYPKSRSWLGSMLRRVPLDQSDKLGSSLASLRELSLTLGRTPGFSLNASRVAVLVGYLPRPFLAQLMRFIVLPAQLTFTNGPM